MPSRPPGESRIRSKWIVSAVGQFPDPDLYVPPSGPNLIRVSHSFSDDMVKCRAYEQRIKSKSNNWVTVTNDTLDCCE